MTRQTHLSGRAARFLQLLQDFGHLDDDTAGELLWSALERRAPQVTGPLCFQELRREAAVSLVDGAPGAALEGILAEDWPLLFS